MKGTIGQGQLTGSVGAGVSRTHARDRTAAAVCDCKMRCNMDGAWCECVKVVGTLIRPFGPHAQQRGGGEERFSRVGLL